MSGDGWQDQLKWLFWGVVAVFNPSMAPAGTKSMSVPVALSRAMAVVYHSQAGAVRVALGRIAAGLPNQDDYPNGQIDPSEYNRRITRIIQEVTMDWDRLEAEVDSVISQIDERERRY